MKRFNFMPVIGLTVDFDRDKYFLRENYVTSLEKYGATVVMLPYSIHKIEDYSNILDGILITGGGFDIHPSNYGCTYVHKEITRVLNDRTNFEIALFKKMFSLNKPILGICGGMQVINVAMGGSLIQHLPDICNETNPTNHSQKFDARNACHQIRIFGKLKEISKIETTMVNSSHHQAVDKLGDCLLVNAIAPDGIIEGIEAKNSNFCMGFQWHPEYFSSQVDHFIFKEFMYKCIE